MDAASSHPRSARRKYCLTKILIAMENRPNIRHKDVAITTIPDLSVSVKAAKGGDWPGSA